MSYRVIVALASLLLMSVFAGVALFGARLADGRLAESLESEARRLKTAYELSQGELEQQMMALAGTIAADPETIRLMRAAGEAVVAEGGAAGGARAAAVRAALAAHRQQQWDYLQREVGVRQMQYLLPDLTSFLRFHAPTQFGDSLGELRYLLRNVEELRQVASGFETGRAFAGIRGAAPVLDRLPDGRENLIGLLEIGIAFDGYIQRLSERTAVGFGVLLDPQAVTAAMWENYRPLAPKEQPGACCYLLAASRGELAEWMAASALPEYGGSFRSDLLRHDGHDFQLIRFPLRDYPGRLDPARPAIGSVLIWQDVGSIIASTREFKQRAFQNLLIAYLVTQLLLFFLVSASRREWQNQLAGQTARIAELLHQNEVLLRTAGEGIFGVDREQVVTFINPAAQKMLGYAQDAVIGQRLHALIHLRGPDGQPCEEAACPVALTLGDGQTRTQEEWLRRSDGGIFPVRMTVSPIREGLGYGGAVVVFHDIGELKEKEAALTRLARTDTLTGLNNRGYFLELLGIEISRWQRNGHHVALLMIDLDCFKRVNDTWGHAVGDEVLRHFSEVLRRSLRRVDIAGRLGGEEFAVLLPGDNEVAALAAAERLRQNVANEAASTSAGAITVTISIGVTLFRAGDSSHEQPLRRADQALYRAKQAGRNRVEADFAAELKPGDAAPADR